MVNQTFGYRLFGKYSKSKIYTGKYFFLSDNFWWQSDVQQDNIPKVIIFLINPGNIILPVLQSNLKK